MSYTLTQRKSNGWLFSEPCSDHMVSAWMTMNWYCVLRPAQRGYAVSSENGFVTRGYYRP